MAWTTPKTWQVDELVTATIMNTHIRDNLNALKAPPSAAYVCDEVSDYVTTSTVFVDVDSTNLALTINTNGGDVLVHFHGMINAYSQTFFNVAVDGTDDGPDDGYISAANGGSSEREAVSFTRLISGLSAGSHTFTLRWKVAAGTGRLYAGAGTASSDVHPQFWVREVS